MKTIVLTKELIEDMYHVCTWYQGRSVDRCINVEKYLDSLKEKNHISDILSEAIKKKHYEPIQLLKNLYPELFNNEKNK